MNNQKKYSQWKAMLAITRASLQSILRNPSAIIFSLAFPIVFIIAFGFLSSPGVSLTIAIDPASDTTGNLYSAFLKSDKVKIESNQQVNELEEKLNKGRIDAILKFKFDAGDQKEIAEVITSKASAEKGFFVKSLLNNLVDKQNILHYKNLSEESGSSPRETSREEVAVAELKESQIAGREYKMIDFILPGQLGFSILSAAVFGTAFVFFSLRQTMVLKRFFATPIQRPYIILGEALSRLVFQLTGSAVIIAMGYFVFGFTLINGVQTAIAMLCLSALGLIVFMGFGFVVSGIAKSDSVIPPLANMVTLPQFLLCGTFFPIDAFPEWLQLISNFLPLTYLNDALRKIAFEGAGFMDISTQISILAAWGVAIYAAAIRFFRWE